MLKKIGIASLVIAAIVALSGLVFTNKFDISTSSLSVIEASIVQISHLRYMIAAIFVLGSTICFAADKIVITIESGNLSNRETNTDANNSNE